MARELLAALRIERPNNALHAIRLFEAHGSASITSYSGTIDHTERGTAAEKRLGAEDLQGRVIYRPDCAEHCNSVCVCTG